MQKPQKDMLRQIHYKSYKGIGRWKITMDDEFMSLTDSQTQGLVQST